MTKTFTLALLGLTALLHAEGPGTRLSDSATVLSEMMDSPDKGVPRDLLEKAECVVVVPGLKKGAFIVGAKYGRGYISCRAESGWSAPAGVMVEGGSLGFQIGGQETDAILLVMNKGGAKKLLSSKFTLGGDASVAAGPVGRTTDAATDLQMHAEILTYSRARGVFAGLSLEGATLRPDKDSNRELYHDDRTNQEIVFGDTKVPEPAEVLLASLRRISPVRQK